MSSKVTNVERYTLQVPFVERVRREMERAAIHPWSELEITKVPPAAGIERWMGGDDSELYVGKGSGRRESYWEDTFRADVG